MTRSGRRPRADGGGDVSFFEACPDPAVRYDTDGDPTVRAVNAAFASAFGTDRDRLEATTLTEALTAVGLDVAAAGWADLQAAISRGDAKRATLQLGADPDARQYLARNAPGTATDSFLLLTEVTDLHDRLDELGARADQLEESARVIAHDIRNPLEVAKINLEVAQETGDDELLEEVADAHENIQRLIDDVLTLAAQGRVIEEQELVDLAAVLEAAWSTVDTKAASLVLDGTLELEADPDRLQQLLENLLRNAVEHGGEDVTVRVDRLDGGDGFFLEDDGPGIPAEARDRIFEQGVSLADAGTGLGLAIVDSISEAHGWTVDAASGRDGGARIEIRVAGEE